LRLLAQKNKDTDAVPHGKPAPGQKMQQHRTMPLQQPTS